MNQRPGPHKTIGKERLPLSNYHGRRPDSMGWGGLLTLLQSGATLETKPADCPCDGERFQSVYHPAAKIPKSERTSTSSSKIIARTRLFFVSLLHTSLPGPTDPFLRTVRFEGNCVESNDRQFSTITVEVPNRPGHLSCDK